MVRLRTASGLALAVGALVAAGWAGWHVVGRWQTRGGLERAERLVGEGRLTEARDILRRLSSWWPRDGELEHRLGVCEAELGAVEAALAAWARVPGRSEAWAEAELARGRLLLRARGRMADAEAAYRAAMRGAPTTALPARWALAELLLWEGRRAEFRALLEEIARVGTETDKIAALREHWREPSIVVAAEELQPVLDLAARFAPNDARADQARAALELARGRPGAARDWLDRCERKLPEDVSIQRARLRWALAAEDVEAARAALERVPARAPGDRAAGPWSLRAWFAERRGDAAAERAALEQVLAIEPGDVRALDRLTALAARGHDAARARSLRESQQTALHDRERYRWLLNRAEGDVDQNGLAERARLAERLGRWFEARGWLELARRRAPTDRALAAGLDRIRTREETARKLAAGTNAGAGAARSMLALLGEPAASPRDGPHAMGEAGPEAPKTAATIVFQDDAERAGLRFKYRNGETPQHPIPETIGGGAAVLDYDNDGWLDVYLVQGGAFPPKTHEDERERDDGAGDRLFHNRGDGTFEDVTGRAGIDRAPRGYGFAVSAADYDNDGYADVFVSRYGSYLLWRNRGDGTFEDATGRAGLGGPRDWPTSSAFADFDGDGDLDLYVCHYLKWDERHPALCRHPTDPERFVSCLPLGLPAMPDHLFRNEGGRFVDVTAEAGIVDRDGRGLGVVAADFDGDGRIDIFVANDMTANLYFHNLGGMRFEERGHLAGVACAASGGYQAGMGVACGDLDGDGRPDLAVTNFFGESTTFYRNLGGGLFADATAAVGLLAPSRFVLGFGAAFFDADNDGTLDLATANGHIHDVRPQAPHAMPAQFFQGGPDGRLHDLTSKLGPPWATPRVGRGLARADLDNDGRIDLLIVSHDAPLAYFHNQSRDAGHYLGLVLEGGSTENGPKTTSGIVNSIKSFLSHVDSGTLNLDSGASGFESVILNLESVILNPESAILNLESAILNLESVIVNLESVILNLGPGAARRSPRDGAGAFVTVRAGGRSQTAWRFGGGSYASAGAPRLHFGLGPARTVETLEVHWPSGRTDRHANLSADAYYRLREGEPPRPMLSR